MNYKINIFPHAANDIKEIVLWYNQKSPGLGKQFTKNIKNTVKILRENPFAFAIKYENKRVVSAKKFPYLIHYKIDELKKEVIILAVLHTKRNPNIWKNIN